MSAARCGFAYCPDCHLPVHQHPDINGHMVNLQPGYQAAIAVPAQLHRHLVAGVVRLGSTDADYGGTRIEHTDVCPAHERPTHPHLAEVWRIQTSRRRELTA